jgi:PAN domain
MPTAINTNSDILQLQRLEIQYKTKMNEYKSAFASYITTMNSQPANAKSYVVLPGKTYMGSGGISDNRNSSVSQCQALCSANKNCTGATFNSISKVCKLRTGKGPITTSASSDNAIITRVNQQLINLETINAQLISLNDQMIVISKRIKPSVNTNIVTLSTNNADLVKNNSDLLKEQIKIKNMLDEFNDIDQNYISQSLNADQKNASYYLWLIIMIVSLILTVKFIAFPDSRGNLLSVILWSVIIICIIIATIHLNNPAAYAIWVILIALVLMMKAQLIPSI